MKIFKFFAAFLVVASTFSCSSDSDSAPSQEEGQFNLTYNGEEKIIDSWIAIKHDDVIEVTANSSSGLGISFKFNTYGNLYQCSVRGNSATSDIPTQKSLGYHSEDTFNFDLTDVDTTNKTITVNFDGQIFDDEYDHTSRASIINGSFSIPYIDYTPQIDNLGTFAKINNVEWHGAQKSTFSDGHSTVLNIQNGTAYEIGIVYPHHAPMLGTFDFTDNDATNRIAFLVYDAETHEMVKWDVSGTVTYTKATVNYVQGTFSFIATDPISGTTKTITDGTFKERTAE